MVRHSGSVIQIFLAMIQIKYFLYKVMKIRECQILSYMIVTFCKVYSSKIFYVCYNAANPTLHTIDYNTSILFVVSLRFSL